VMNTVRKRVHRGQTMGPYYNLDATALPLPHYAINSMGAVPKKDCDDLRCVDDVKANDMTTPPPFKYPSMEWLRATALPGGYWWLVDIRDAFANLPLSPQDKRWLLFRWYDVDDLKFSGTPHDCLYFHSMGCFGPRSLPCLYTAMQLHVNIAAIGAGIPPVMGYMDDNAAHRQSYADSLQSLMLYLKHLDKSGLPYKDSKTKYPFQIGEILGRWFDSINMTISITPNKLIELTSMFAYVAKPGSQLSFKQLESFMGFWEFCLECLPVPV
jgi:hypothetical protein